MNTTEQCILKGTIERFLFQSADNGFSIFVLNNSEKEQFVVKGNLPNIQIGQEVELRGNWDFHKKFGKQFNAIECATSLPTSVSGLKKYLGSGLIKGIGKVYAEKLVKHFGINTLQIIDKNPERLHEVGGIGAKRVEAIAVAWKDQKEIAQLMVFLQDKGVTPLFATKIYKQYRHNAYAVLQENPYKIADDIWGVGFKTADQIALKLGFHPHAPQRISAALIYVISSATSHGHLYCELTDLRQKTIDLLELPAEYQDRIKLALHDLYNADKIKLITDEDKHFITTSAYYYSEQSVATLIKKLITYPLTTDINIQKIYDLLRKVSVNEIELNEDQQRGVMAALQHKITIITGGPGTGKTTLIKKLLMLLESEKITYKLAAPTGRAAKRIMEGTGRAAATLHRLLEFDASTMRFTHNETNALKLDYLIIDEASMIDIFLAHSILKAVPLNAHLVLIGDVDQLPSVGAGNFLNDCIASGLITCVRLTQIFRQAQDSLITVNAHRVNRGEFPTTFLPNARPDFMFFKEDEPEKITDHLKRILFIELKKRGIALDDAQVLVPMNRGIVGTHNLNHHLQHLLNPGQKEQVALQGTAYKLNDRVMQIRNNYDKLIFNGDIGRIAHINLESKTLEVNFNDRIVEYDFDELQELVLAYAITIHKSQGSEYGAAIIPIFTQHFTLLQRNLIYTAITRAKKLCILIGQSRAIAMAINNNKGTKRITFLQKFLKDQ